jgi:hypothetical protein
VELFRRTLFTSCDVRRSRFMGPAQGCVLELQICIHGGDIDPIPGTSNASRSLSGALRLEYI